MRNTTTSHPSVVHERPVSTVSAQEVEIRSVRHPVVDAGVLQALRAGDPGMLADAMHNDLQAPALHLQPGLARILERGEESGALGGLVSGSGPTVA